MARRLSEVCRFVLYTFVMLMVAAGHAAAEGKFEGELLFKPLDDGRNFEVVSEFQLC